MMKPHCDRCDKLLNEPYAGWVEEKEAPGGKKFIWHIQICASGEQKDLCRTCAIAILTEYVKKLT